MPAPDEKTGYCDVAIPHTRLDALTYSYDRSNLPALAPGDCVQVTLRSRTVAGIVTLLRRRSPIKGTLTVKSLLRPGLLTPGLVELAKWVGAYYFARLGDVMSVVLPRRVERHELKVAAVVPAAREAAPSADRLPAAFTAAVEQQRFGVWVSCRGDGCRELADGAVARILRHGSALVMVPEPQLHEWSSGLRGLFGAAVVEYHSGPGPTALRRAWLDLRHRERAVVLGVRSAAFTPSPDVRGCLIVEDHNQRYKEERRPRFHARDVAVARARLAGFPVLVAGETPALETWYNCRAGRYDLFEPPQARGQYGQAFVADMRLHRGALFSPRLQDELRRARAAGRSAVLHVNRRGLSRFAACRECGEALRCPGCAMPLVVGRIHVGCRHCGAATQPPERCPSCGSVDFDFRAAGVEMVVRELRRLLGDVPVTEVVSESKQGVGPGFLVGTNALLSRGWPEGTALVAAVDADAGMALPDFRARERAFHTLWSLCRRGEDMHARVVVQTRRPEDAAVRSAVECDAALFLDAELRQRRELGFPPFSRLALLKLSGRPVEELERKARLVLRAAERSRRVAVLGPVPVPGRAPEVRLLVRLPRDVRLTDILSLDGLDALKVDWRVDVDPLELV